MSLLAASVILLVYLMIAGVATAAQYLYFRHNRKRAAPTGSQRALIVLDSFAGMAALIGLVILLTGWGYQFPISWLEGTPFSDYTVPAVILGIVVGGSALLAMWAMIKSASVGAVASLAAGVIMMGWVIGEYILVPDIRFSFTDLATWQQGLFFLVGLAMAVLALRVISGGWRSTLHTAHPA
jgi:hypothetical protein